MTGRHSVEKIGGTSMAATSTLFENVLIAGRSGAGSGDAFAADVERRGRLLERRLDRIAAGHGLATRGRGMMRGLDMGSGEAAGAVTAACFDQGLIIETSGAHDEVVKVLAPLVIDNEILSAGLDIVERAVAGALSPALGVAA